MSSCATSGQKRRLFKDAGRACPIDYRIPEDAFAGTPDLECDVLYVVGGLYGNPFAMDAIDGLVQTEDPMQKTLVILNGDMHWFDKTAENFADIERRAEPYIPLVGNVEAELRRQNDVGVGCGCAYPECTADDSVARSNRIHKMLSLAVEEHPDFKALLDGRPATATVNVAGKKVAISHGDEKLIGGWDNSRETLQDVLRQDEVDTFMEKNDIDVFTTTHTCAPVAIRLARGVVVNNGAAGLPNFEGQNYGLCIRLATTSREDSLFECNLDGLWIQAIPVRYDHDAYLDWFDKLWSKSSPAAISYRSRIVNGPDDKLEDSLLGGIALGETALAEKRGRFEEENERGEQPHRANNDDVHLALESLLYFEDMLEDNACRCTVDSPSTIQVNITAKCNMACKHCHVESSPTRTEQMSRETLEAILKVARDRNVQTIDITGGAPEMHPDIEWFLREAASIVPHVMLRSNLVILEDPAYAHLVDLFCELNIEIVASLPNVFKAESDAQRGKNTYDSTIEMLRLLNSRGYGKDGEHVLDVVFNPQEPILPPEQDAVEEMYRRRLSALGIEFDNLFAIANNPIGRYGEALLNDGVFEGYMDLLMDAYNPETEPAIMCRHQMNVGWDGRIYDCDFNHAIKLGACPAILPENPSKADVDRALLRNGDAPLTIFDYADNPERPLKRAIVFGNHCYACTAGFGSSCGGTLVQEA